jgi:hypothetical protein
MYGQRRFHAVGWGGVFWWTLCVEIRVVLLPCTGSHDNTLSVLFALRWLYLKGDSGCFCKSLVNPTIAHR